jgi:hypothetical protein
MVKLGARRSTELVPSEVEVRLRRYAHDDREQKSKSPARLAGLEVASGAC